MVTEESLPRMASSVPLMHQDPSDLGLIFLVMERKIRISILDFLKESHPKIYGLKDERLIRKSLYRTPRCYQLEKCFLFCNKPLTLVIISRV